MQFFIAHQTTAEYVNLWVGWLWRDWDSKTSTIANLILIQNDCKFCDCSTLYMTCFKIVMTTTYLCSDHQSDSLLPMHWKMISLNLAKLFSFYISNEIFGHSAMKTTLSPACLVRDTWEWNSPIFAHFADIFTLPERIVAWSLLQYPTIDSLSP